MMQVSDKIHTPAALHTRKNPGTNWMRLFRP